MHRIVQVMVTLMEEFDACATTNSTIKQDTEFQLFCRGFAPLSTGHVVDVVEAITPDGQNEASCNRGNRPSSRTVLSGRRRERQKWCKFFLKSVFNIALRIKNRSLQGRRH